MYVCHVCIYHFIIKFYYTEHNSLVHTYTPILFFLLFLLLSIVSFNLFHLTLSFAGLLQFYFAQDLPACLSIVLKL